MNRCSRSPTPFAGIRTQETQRQRYRQQVSVIAFVWREGRPENFRVASTDNTEMNHTPSENIRIGVPQTASPRLPKAR